MNREYLISQLRIEVSSDQMKAQVRVPRAVAVHLEIGHIIALLDSHGIKFGFDKAKVMSQLEQIYNNPDDPHFRALTVAQGNPLVDSQDGLIELLIQKSANVTVDVNGRADFRNIDKFKQIKKGTLLARRIPPVPGKDGNNIYGKIVHPRQPSDPKLICGDNVVFLEEKNEYRSTENGIFTRKGNEISINPVLYIQGNAGIESGNLVYDGKVHIKGNIERGALVSTLGDLRVEGFIESDLIRVGASLHVHKGINTQSKGTIYVEEDLYSNYLDNTKILVLGNMNIERSINASTIMVHGNADMGKKRSVIVGGTLHVFGSLTADYIGSDSGTPTKIVLGLHHANESYHKIYSAELKEPTRKYNDLHKKMIDYKERLSTRGVPPGLREKMNESYQEYKMYGGLVQRLKEQVIYYSKNKINPKAVRITARVALYPGVQFIYNGQVHQVKASLHKSIIEFSPNKKEPKYMRYTPEEEQKQKS